MERLREVLAELDVEEDEHPDVSLSHDSEWTLSAFPGGLLVWEKIDEDDEPKHMRGVSREWMLELWLRLSRGEIAEISAEPWVPGYGSLA